MSWKEYSLNQEQSKLPVEQPRVLLIKICPISLSDLLVNVCEIQRKINEWSNYYEEFDEVYLETEYRPYDNESVYFLMGKRLEYPHETQKRVDEFKKDQEKSNLLKKDKEEKELKQKRELFEKLKKELGETHE